MLNAEQNKRITETGPGTPCGGLMRRYWQPAALAEELASARPVKRVRLLGEDLVLFRDPSGRHGLLHRHCAASRRRPGVRPVRGWRPALPVPWLAVRCRRRLPGTTRGTGGQHVPSQSSPAILSVRRTFRHRLGLPGTRRTTAIPGVRLLRGAGQPCVRLQRPMVLQLAAGAGNRHRSRARQLPASFLPGRRPVGRRLRPPVPRRDHRRRYPHDPPDARSAQSSAGVRGNPYGLRITTLRPINDQVTHLRITNLVLPHGFVIPLSREMTITQFHVPIDDTHCYWYALFTSFGAPVDKATMRAQRLEITRCRITRRSPAATTTGVSTPGADRATYTGMGMDINVHDQWAVESTGPIADRTKEHLGYSDRVIIAARRMIFRAIDDVAEGRDPPGIDRRRPTVPPPSTLSAPPTTGNVTGAHQEVGAAAQPPRAARLRCTPRERFRHAARLMDARAGPPP